MNDFAEPQPMTEPMRADLLEVVRLRDANPVPVSRPYDYKDFFSARTASLITETDTDGRYIPAEDCLGKIYSAKYKKNKGVSLWVIDDPLTDPAKIKAVVQELADDTYCQVSMMRDNSIGQYTDEPMTRYKTAEELLTLTLMLKDEFPAGAPTPSKPLFYFRHNPTEVQMIGHERTWEMARGLVDVFGVSEDELLDVMAKNQKGYRKRLAEFQGQRHSDGVIESIFTNMAHRHGLPADKTTWDVICRTPIVRNFPASWEEFLANNYLDIKYIIDGIKFSDDANADRFNTNLMQAFNIAKRMGDAGINFFNDSLNMNLQSVVAGRVL